MLGIGSNEGKFDEISNHFLPADGVRAIGGHYMRQDERIPGQWSDPDRGRNGPGEGPTAHRPADESNRRQL